MPEKCSHCHITVVHFDYDTFYLGGDKNDHWFIKRKKCPNCECYTFELINSIYTDFQNYGGKTLPNTIKNKVLINPLKGPFESAPPEVPSSIADDFNEANTVLPFSPKASAALSRRCLQAILTDLTKSKNDNLSNLIQITLDQNLIPSKLHRGLDLVRIVGNYAAHPQKSSSSGILMEVEPEEAQLNLEVLSELFEEVYIKPKILAEKFDKYDKKLKSANKKPLRK